MNRGRVEKEEIGEGQVGHHKENDTDPTSRSRQRGKFTAAQIDRAAQDRRAVELRHQHATYDEIAVALGMSNRSVAFKAVQRAMERWAGTDVEELRTFELSRTDDIIAPLLPLATSDPPDLAAIDALMKVLHYRARITGLYTPQKHQVGVQIDATIDLRAIEAAELLQQRPELAAVIDNVLEASADVEAANSETAGDNSGDREATGEDGSGDKETPGDV